MIKGEEMGDGMAPMEGEALMEPAAPVEEE